ncbi:hypothetical protein MMC29_005399, partial [Sticta canariensis]|nr:hypothetical protein [Sticta canariensis]
MPTQLKAFTSSRLLTARVVLLLLGFIAIVCFASAISVSKEYNEQHNLYSYPNDGQTTGLEWPNGIALSSVIASFAWTVFVLLQPIHNQLLNPGYSVGFDCFSWVYITVCCISGASFSGYHDYDTAKASTIKGLEIAAYLCAFIMVLSDPFHPLCLRVSGNADTKPGTLGGENHFGNRVAYGADRITPGPQQQQQPPHFGLCSHRTGCINERRVYPAP